MSDTTQANEPKDFITEILQKLGDMKKAYQEACMAAVEPVVEALFRKHGEVLPMIVVVGYTPSWNDGEPCYHSHDLYSPSDYPEAYDLEENEADTFGYKGSNEKVVEDYSHAMYALSDAFEMAYNTNYQVTFTWDGEKVTTNKDDYNCDW